MARYRLTNDADRDLLDIFIDGLGAFGLAQAERYSQGMAECFDLLAGNPRLGRKAPSVGPNMRRHEHGAHVVFYEEEEDGILIIAVIHGHSIRHLKL